MKIGTMQLETAIIGSGAAGLRAAIALKALGRDSLMLFTDGLDRGTSLNAGSDKQTYYKLSLAGASPDSVREMAQDLFNGGCVDGDQALPEAALSASCFAFLCHCGVPFPQNEFGEYIGYITDNDSHGRASSAGPYTSRQMTQALRREALRADVMLSEGWQLVKIFPGDRSRGLAHGLLFLNLEAAEGFDIDPASPSLYRLVFADNVILATGGPADIYKDSVFPESQTGATGLALEAGVRGKNLTEWQFGLASVSPRWNVSGTYMQCLPRFISTNSDGTDPREFLPEHLKNPSKLLNLVFLKGYQWPFDAERAADGSSLIDLYCFDESVAKGRRIWLDFTANPLGGAPVEPALLSPESLGYLTCAGAAGELLASTPAARLRAMNEPAYQFYLDRGIDLEHDRLEIRLCAQHHNGGLLTDTHWETNVPGIYAIGEASGDHGVKRPGGSALNAGQVGAVRAAEHIYECSLRGANQLPPPGYFASLLAAANEFVSLPSAFRGNVQVSAALAVSRERMSGAAGILRTLPGLKEAREDTATQLAYLSECLAPVEPAELPLFYRLRNCLLTQYAVLFAMEEYAGAGGSSRGSGLYTGSPSTGLASAAGPDLSTVQEITLTTSGALPDTVNCVSVFRPVRPIPSSSSSFESAWKEYRKRRGSN